MELYGKLEDQKALPGMLFGTESRSIVSCPMKTDVEMGKAVFCVSGEFQATGTNENQFFGIACFTQIAGTTGKNFYKAKDTANVITRGYVWVKTSASNPAFNTPAFVDISTGLVKPTGDYAVGRFRGEKQGDLVLVELIETAAK